LCSVPIFRSLSCLEGGMRTSNPSICECLFSRGGH
jgi:hypothetical protein